MPKSGVNKKMYKFKFQDLMNTMKIGKLEKVDIRELWKGEASDFTLWLEYVNLII